MLNPLLSPVQPGVLSCLTAAPYLRVNAEWPAAPLVHCNAIFRAEVILRQAPDVPLPDLDRVAQHGWQAEPGAAVYACGAAGIDPGDQAVGAVYRCKGTCRAQQGELSLAVQTAAAAAADVSAAGHSQQGPAAVQLASTGHRHRWKGKGASPRYAIWPAANRMSPVRRSYCWPSMAAAAVQRAFSPPKPASQVLLCQGACHSGQAQPTLTCLLHSFHAMHLQLATQVTTVC